MNTCPNCGRTAYETYCSNCGTYMATAETQESPRMHKTGKKGAIARLIVAALTVIITLVSAVAALFSDFTHGFGSAIMNLVATLGTGCVVGVIILVMWRWLGFIVPKSLRWANHFWRSWQALSIFGLYLKACIWVFIFLLPVSALTSLLSSVCFFLVALLSNTGMNFLIALAYLAVSGGLMAVFVFLDVCKVKEWSAMAVLKEKLTSLRKENPSVAEPSVH